MLHLEFRAVRLCHLIKWIILGKLEFGLDYEIVHVLLWWYDTWWDFTGWRFRSLYKEKGLRPAGKGHWLRTVALVRGLTWSQLILIFHYMGLNVLGRNKKIKKMEEKEKSGFLMWAKIGQHYQSNSTKLIGLQESWLMLRKWHTNLWVLREKTKCLWDLRWNNHEHPIFMLLLYMVKNTITRSMASKTTWNSNSWVQNACGIHKESLRCSLWLVLLSVEEVQIQTKSQVYMGRGRFCLT